MSPELPERPFAGHRRTKSDRSQHEPYQAQVVLVEDGMQVSASQRRHVRSDTCRHSRGLAVVQ